MHQNCDTEAKWKEPRECLGVVILSYIWFTTRTRTVQDSPDIRNKSPSGNQKSMRLFRLDEKTALKSSARFDPPSWGLRPRILEKFSLKALLKSSARSSPLSRFLVQFSATALNAHSFLSNLTLTAALCFLVRHSLVLLHKVTQSLIGTDDRSSLISDMKHQSLSPQRMVMCCMKRGRSPTEETHRSKYSRQPKKVRSNLQQCWTS